jgi:hypothetical protein
MEFQGMLVADVVPGSGPYDEQVIFNTVPGAADTAAVTINGNGEIITAFTTTTDRYVIRLTDVQYFGITNLRVVRDTTSSGGFYGIHIFNTGRNISITNCSCGYVRDNKYFVWCLRRFRF